MNEDNRKLQMCICQPDQVSLAIGKGGFNIKLAGECLPVMKLMFIEMSDELDG